MNALLPRECAFLSRSDTAAVALETRAFLSEDVLALILGLAIFALALLSFVGSDALGWVVTTSVWTDPTKALGPLSKAYAEFGGAGALGATFFALLIALTLGALTLGRDAGRFAA